MEHDQAVYLAYGGPIVILVIFLYRFRRRLSLGQKIVAFILVYIMSFATGLVVVISGNYGESTSSLIMGVGAGLILPIIYFLAFSPISRRNPPPTAVGPTPLSVPLAPVAPFQPDRTSQWNPLIRRAIIQPIG